MLALLSSVVLVAVACTGGGGSQTKNTTAQIVEVKDHIVGMDVSSSIDAKGQPVDPSFTFDPTAKQITVLAQVGNLAGDPPLVFTWSETTSGGDKALFSQTVKVQSLDVAFSVGKSPGTLAVGTYKITATLGGETKSTEAVVSTPPPSTPTSSTASALSSSGNQASAGAGPPVSGRSGAVPQSAPAPPPGTGTAWMASADFASGFFQSVDWEYDVGSSKPTSYTADLSVQVNGGTPAHRQFHGTTVVDSTGEAFDAHFWTADPCNVRGGSDLPGTKVVVSDQTSSSLGQSSGTDTAVLHPDTMAPVLTKATSVPPPGTKVKPGDKITFTVPAEETKGPDVSPQTGVHQIGIRRADVQGDVVPSKTFGSTPLPCDQKSWKQTATFTYTVPATPKLPPILHLFAYAKDFANNPGAQEFDYPTTDIWDGVLDAKTTGTIPGASCHQPWRVTFEITAKDGVVSGVGAADPLSRPSCPLAAGAPLAGHTELSVKGTFDGHTFALQFYPTGGEGGFDTGLHVLWLPKQVTIKVPWDAATSTGTAQVHIFDNSSAEGANGTGTASLDGPIQILLKKQ